MKPALLSLVTSTAFWVNVAFAADWQLVGKPSSAGRGGYLQLDRASVIKNGEVVTAWTRAVYEEELEIPDGAGLRARVVVALTDFKCKSRTETTRRVVFLSDDASMMVMAERGPFETTDIIPDTAKDRVFAIVCRKGK